MRGQTSSYLHRWAMPTLTALSLFLTVAINGATAQVNTATMRVTLLGTGSPIPDPPVIAQNPTLGRAGSATLVEAGSETLLFDVGRGTVDRLASAGVKAPQLTAVFLTHFHSDHISDLPDLWLSSRILMDWGKRITGIDLWGPVGAVSLAQGITKAFELDIQGRPLDVQIPLNGHEFKEDGVVFDRNGVKVTAFTVDHGVTKPAVGYRVDYMGRSVLISGDTKLNDNVIKYGKGVDLLLHEVLAVSPALLKAKPELVRIFNLHTSPEQCGTVFEQTKPKLAAFTHIVQFGDAAPGSKMPPPSIGEILSEAQAVYKGKIVAGEDLMSFDIGDQVVIRPSRQ